MPEAVIVSAARSPIGRANKGSLKDLRPDDLAATIVRTALDKVPALDPHTVDDLYLGCGLPGGEQGFNMGRVVNVLNGMDDVPGATITRYCASSVQTTRMAFHAIKAGEGDVFISAGVEMVSRFAKGTSDHWPDTQNPRLRRRRRAYGEDRRGRPGLARPARGRHRPRHLHRDGPDRRERRPAARPDPRGARRVRRPHARTSPRRRSPTASGPARSPRSPRPTAPRSAPTTARGPGVTIEARRRAQAGLPPRRRRDRRQLLPAQRRRRRGRDHVRHQGRRARPHPAGPDRRPPASAASRPRSWASARSRRPSGRSPTPA